MHDHNPRPIHPGYDWTYWADSIRIRRDGEAEMVLLLSPSVLRSLVRQVERGSSCGTIDEYVDWVIEPNAGEEVIFYARDKELEIKALFMVHADLLNHWCGILGVAGDTFNMKCV